MSIKYTLFFLLAYGTVCKFYSTINHFSLRMGKRLMDNDLELLKRVSERIKQLRKEKKISQRQFHYDTGMNAERIEGGKNNYELTTIQAICKYYNISLKDFFSDL